MTERLTMHCTVDTTECLLSEKSAKPMMALPLSNKRATSKISDLTANSKLIADCVCINNAHQQRVLT